MAKKTALLGMLVALAFVLSYIETLIPINLGIPGAKLGLANLVVMVALYTLGTKEAFALSMVRILLTGLTFSSMAAMLYSFAGGLLSFAVMYLAKRSKLFSAVIPGYGSTSLLQSVPCISSFKQRSQSVTLYSCRHLKIRVSINALLC